MGKHLVHQKITSRVDEDTGEVIMQEESKIISVKTSEEAFFQTYIGAFASFFELSSAIDMKVLMKFCCLANFNTGEVRLVAKDRKELCEELGIKLPALSRSIKALKDRNLLTEDEGMYLINPSIFWKGDKKERARLLKEGRLSVTINFEAND